jgi:lipopolysaccharide export system permease protein
MDTRTKKIRDIFIQDQRNKDMHYTIIAPQADLLALADSPVLIFTLYNGSISQVDLSNHSANTSQFKKYEMKLDLKQTVDQKGGRDKRLKAMSLKELRQVMAETPPSDNRYYKAMLKYYEKFALPFACFALGILAIPLGIESRTSKRSMGIVIGIVLFLFYYIMLLVGWSLGETGSYHPLLGMWTPNVVLGGIGMVLYIRSIKDQSVIPEWMSVYKIRRLWPRQRGSRQPQRT